MQETSIGRKCLAVSKRVINPALLHLLVIKAYPALKLSGVAE